MSLPLPADILASIDAQIASGLYESEEQVLRVALESLERQNRTAKLKEMVRVAEEDVAAGRVGQFDRAQLKEEVRTALAQRGISD